MNDILSAIGVLLVFLTFLLGSIQGEISNILDEKEPESSQTSQIRIYKSKIRKVFWLKSLPITLIFLIISYILIPSSVKIITESQIDFWNFDALNTIFIFVEIGLLGLTSFSIFKSFQLISKL